MGNWQTAKRKTLEEQKTIDVRGLNHPKIYHENRKTKIKISQNRKILAAVRPPSRALVMFPCTLGDEFHKVVHFIGNLVLPLTSDIHQIWRTDLSLFFFKGLGFVSMGCPLYAPKFFVFNVSSSSSHHERQIGGKTHSTHYYV